jgi:hypothetical protein
MKTATKPSAADPAQTAAHTPAPWVYVAGKVIGPEMPWPARSDGLPDRVNASIVAELPSGGCGASYRHYPFAVTDANGRLITAAPELLAIARAVQNCINAHDCEHPDFADSCADVCAMLDEIAGDVKAAIAKAEGRAS